MIDNLVSSPVTRMLEQTMSFTEQRHDVLLADIANASTPGYVQKDISVAEFQGALRDAVKRQGESLNGTYEPNSGETVAFEPGSSTVTAKPTDTVNGVAFHDRGVRNMEYLMSQMADNALAHNVTAQLLKGRYDQMARAISMKV